MANLKSKHEQLLETLSPDKSDESIRQMRTIIENVENALEEYRLERQRRMNEIQVDAANVIFTA